MTAAAPVLKAPFPYFGGKSRVAKLVWERFGEVRNYVEPFFGSGAMLLGRPQPFRGPETVNDADGFIANFWRALQADPDEVAHYADWPVNENDLHARHAWLVERKDSLQSRLEGDPDWHDAKIAGWWVWGLCGWIGSGWCSGKGPWRVVDGDDGPELAKVANAGRGVNRQLPHLANAGRGVNRQLPHLANAGRGVNRQRPHLANAGRGVNRQRPHLADAGRGVNRQRPHLADAGRGYDVYADFEALAARLRSVRVCCGDWSRAVQPSVTVKHAGTTAVFLDPPYLHSAGRDEGIYRLESATVAESVREWAIANGDDPRLRIALCGYDGEHAMPGSWSEVAWKTSGGYGKQSNGRGRANSNRERIWFSPHCLNPAEAESGPLRLTA